MPRPKKKIISIIIPVYNEASNLAWHHKVIVTQLKKISTHKFEVIYINDGSRDNSLQILKKICAKDKSARYLSFSRNFGKEPATTAGLLHCRGDAAIMIDADGQHPIKLLSRFIKKWEAGAEVVVGVRKENTKEGFIKRYGSRLFYRIFNMFTANSTIPGSTDFRLLDRRVINEFNKLSERNRITRGLIDWLGFKRDYIYFVAAARHDGRATYSFRKLAKLAIHALVSQTTEPLKLTGYLGGIVTVISALLGIFLAIETYVFGDPLGFAVTGSAILALFVSFLVGIVLICQWLLALYIESIHAETQARPLFIVSESSED